MKVLKTVDEVRAFRRESSGTLGFVPTMGALHEGHAELMKVSSRYSLDINNICRKK